MQEDWCAKACHPGSGATFSARLTYLSCRSRSGSVGVRPCAGMAGLAKLCSAMLRETKTIVQEIANRVATARRTAWAVHLADGGGAAVSLSRRLDTVGSRMARNGQNPRRSPCSPLQRQSLRENWEMNKLTTVSALALIVASGSAFGEVSSETLQSISIPDTSYAQKLVTTIFKRRFEVA